MCIDGSVLLMDRETDLSAFICVEAVVATRGVVVLQYSRYLLSLSFDEAISVLTSRLAAIFDNRS